ncbi:MAG: hypothetical protein CSA68_08350 [Rhodobacterales bacterium]|nr:MAG: hypothetical protein CSA68_08350 [Rhodobacterales bacterium]
MTLFWRIFWITSLAALAACTPRGIVSVFPEAALVGQVRSIFVGSTRGMNPDGSFNKTRAENLSFHRYDVSIPPDRKPGKITWPGSNPDPKKHFLTTGINHFSSAHGFEKHLSQTLKSLPPKQREVVVFVHGFNNSFAEGLYRFAQLTNDLALPNPTVHYSWPSAANPLGYVYDRDSALFARDGLEEMLKTIKAAGGKKILLVGHSMGSLLVMETLRQMAIENPRGFADYFSGIILISPDIDIDLFHQQAAKIGDLPQPFAIFISQKDRALRLSARLSGKHKRLGNIRNVSELAELQVTLIDVTNFYGSPSGHFTAATSPALLRILGKVGNVDAAFRNDRTGRAGLLPGTILTVQKATHIILSPATAAQ